MSGPTYKELVQNYADRATQAWNGLKVYVANVNSGTVYVNAGGALQHDPASLNKLMMFYITMRAVKQGVLDLDDTLVASRAAGTTSYAKIRPGTRMSLETAVEAMMINSDNGATTMIAERLERALKVDAVDHMNATAKRLGMNHTHYGNPHGLPNPKDRNRTTAEDIAILMRQIYKDFPEEAKELMSPDTVRYSGQVWRAHHKLNRPGAEQRSEYEVAAKTGYTNRASHNIASMISGPDNQKLIVVVMGADWTNTNKLEAIGLPKLKADIKGGGVRGSSWRDELVQQLADTFLGGKLPFKKESQVPEKKPAPKRSAELDLPIALAGLSADISPAFDATEVAPPGGPAASATRRLH